MSTTAIIRCDGCGNTFTLTGHEKHLRTTTKPACVALRQKIQFRPLEEASDQDSADDDHDLDGSPSPQPFTGDAFGAYDDDYWDQYDEYQPGDPDNEDEDEDGPYDDFQPPATPPHEADEDDFDMQEDEEEDAENLEAEHGWEPPVNEADRPVSGEGDPSDDRADHNNLDGEPGPDRRTQQRAHQQLRTRTHVVPYPDSSAGAPTIPGDPLAPVAPGESPLADPSNPYAPFRSRLEFELARWAKMRGPGSNAVTELLSIEGVRLSVVCDPNISTLT